MKCDICSYIFSCVEKNMCHFCNKVVCDKCQSEYKGIPSKRLFKIEDNRCCYVCFSLQKYENM